MEANWDSKFVVAIDDNDDDDDDEYDGDDDDDDGDHNNEDEDDNDDDNKEWSVACSMDELIIVFAVVWLSGVVVSSAVDILLIGSEFFISQIVESDSAADLNDADL